MTPAAPREFFSCHRDPEPAYILAPSHELLDTVLCVKELWTASNGSVISYHGQLYRLVDNKERVLSLPPKAKVEVLVHLDNYTDALYRGNDAGSSRSHRRSPPLSRNGR